MPGTSTHLFIHVGGWSLHKHRASWPSTPSTRPSPPSTNPSPPSTNPSAPPNPQPPLQDSWLPPPNQLDTGAQCSPPAYLPPSHHPPPHFTSARGSPVDDLDGDLYDDPYTDDNGPLSAPHHWLLDPFCCHQPSSHSPKHMCHY
ncbi:uncharacterized protein BJ212DRAFT_1479262 [Suillus subaureus]|uniref:Uncharacterized protein n=1 Tax=Suillus subaureus TaxID=48587 RepID=A0A9P7EER6_9AGAM|nr:uncharacterized protein BJ212DRAFT_1479262 [Suillus subaureus]KAG1819156.1 hypothetical protein BJ212DRAFT_1479262 [Suillus subaureus]